MEYNEVSALSYTRSVIEKYGFNFKKKYGQNFLIDDNILKNIVEESDIEDELVVEIGPGIGALSRYLAKKAKKLILIEIDKTLIPILEDNFGSMDNVEIINEDVLKVDFNELATKYGYPKIKVVANLPYYITTPIVMKLLEEDYNITSMTIMVQKEVGLRMQAKPATKDYGALTLAVNYYSMPKILMTVKPSCFMPRPNVDSVVIRLDIKEGEDDRDFRVKLFKFIRAAFNQRRKTLVNGVKNGLGMDREVTEKALVALGHSPNVRGEALSLEEFICLVKELEYGK